MQWKRFWKRFCRNKTAVAGLGIILALVVGAAFAPLLAPYPPDKINLRNACKGPSAAHLLGTDMLGRDILSRVLFGARISMYLSFTSVLASLIIGGALGLIAGYYRGFINHVITWFTDLALSFPSFLLALAIVSFLGPGLSNLLFALVISSVPRFTRVVKGTVLIIKESDYVNAARAIGASSLRIMLRTILPNSFAPALVQATIRIAEVVLIASGLGFLGLGVQPPTPEWGLMVSEGRFLLRVAPHIVAVPGCAIALFALGFNLLGDGLRDALDVEMA